MKCIALIIVLIGASQAQKCDLIEVVVQEQLAAVKDDFVNVIKKNTDDFATEVGNVTLNVGNFKAAIDELLKDYTNNSCVNDFLMDLKASTDGSQSVIATDFNPTRLDKVSPEYQMKLFDVIKTGVDDRAAALRTHFTGMAGLNETCYLDKFRDGYRDLMFEFGTGVPDLLNELKKIIDGRLIDSVASMVKWIADLVAGIDVCKANPYTVYCVDAFLSDNKDKIMEETNVGEILKKFKGEFGAKFNDKITATPAVIAERFQGIYTLIGTCVA